MAPKLIFRMIAPPFLSRGGVDTYEISPLTDGEHQIAICGGCAARPGKVAPARRVRFADLGRPERFAIGAVQRDHPSGIILFAHREDAISRSNDGGETRPEPSCLPQQ